MEVESNVFTSGSWIILQATECETTGRRDRQSGGV